MRKGFGNSLMIDEFIHLISDPAHLAFEVATTIIIEGLFLTLLWPFVKRAIVKHDREKH